MQKISTVLMGEKIKEEREHKVSRGKRQYVITFDDKTLKYKALRDVSRENMWVFHKAVVRE